MQLNANARRRRNTELRTKESEIAALYRLLKTDEEIALELHLDVTSVRLARASMFLPVLRTKSGRLFTPEIDQRMMDMRDIQGVGFNVIARNLGITVHEAEVRHRTLTRLRGQKEAAKDAAIVPCMLCRKSFWSEDRRRIRFCQRCRSGPVQTADSGPFDI